MESNQCPSSHRFSNSHPVLPFSNSFLCTDSFLMYSQWTSTDTVYIIWLMLIKFCCDCNSRLFIRTSTLFYSSTCTFMYQMKFWCTLSFISSLIRGCTLRGNSGTGWSCFLISECLTFSVALLFMSFYLSLLTSSIYLRANGEKKGEKKL